jgi:predicted NAD-dependent protein-ADP-ribosyltransferase YbiA (DUF1768 family)
MSTSISSSQFNQPLLPQPANYFGGNTVPPFPSESCDSFFSNCSTVGKKSKDGWSLSKIFAISTAALLTVIGGAFLFRKPLGLEGFFNKFKKNPNVNQRSTQQSAGASEEIKNLFNAGATLPHENKGFSGGDAHRYNMAYVDHRIKYPQSAEKDAHAYAATQAKNNQGKLPHEYKSGINEKDSHIYNIAYAKHRAEHPGTDRKDAHTYAKSKISAASSVGPFQILAGPKAKPYTQAWMNHQDNKAFIDEHIKKGGEAKAVGFYESTEDFAEFANTFPCTKPMQWKGLTLHKSETIFQLHKLLDENGNLKVSPQDFAALAKELEQASGSQMPNIMKNSPLIKAHRPYPSQWWTDWDNIGSQKAMDTALALKLQHNPDYAGHLRNTGKAIIVESTKNDAKWGSGEHGEGQNLLGKSLMNYRDTKL